MQNMQMQAGPVQGPNQQQGGQNIAQNIPNIVGQRGGWYPRWWLIAAFCTTVAFLIGMGLWTPVLCPVGAPHAFICQINTWPYATQVFLTVLLIWLLFIGFWLLALTLGMGIVELPRRQPSEIGAIIRSLSEFGSVSPLLLLYGGIALALMLIMWWLDILPPTVFSFLSIILFVANSSLFYRLTPEERRGYLIGYGLIGSPLLFLLEVLFKPNFLSHLPPPADEGPLLFLQVLLIVIAIIALFRRPRPNPQLAAQQILNMNINRAPRPLRVLGSLPLLNRLFAPRPIMNNQAQQGNQPPGPRAP